MSYERETDPEVRDHPLSITLGCAVPLWIAELKAKGGPSDSDVAAAQAFGIERLGPEGDILQFRGKKCGQSASMFNSLAHAVAVMSFRPGGIYVFGERWETTND